MGLRIIPRRPQNCTYETLAQPEDEVTLNSGMLSVLFSESTNYGRIPATMPKQSYFTPELFKFFRQLKRNNNREWFLKHKQQYEEVVRDPFLKFISDFQPRLHKISPHFMVDPKPNGGSLLRIYKDLRFRPDSPPYKTMAAARFPHNARKQTPAPGLYLHIEAGQTFYAGGLWRPDPQPRNQVREAILEAPAQWKKAAKGKRFTTLCEISKESSNKLAPGIDPSHPLAEDLRLKDFTFHTMFTDAQVCAPDFLDRVVEITQAAAPYMEFLTRALGLPWSSGERLSQRELSNVESFAVS
jgi:uncharacterized protein (TIGR02453 family)